MPATRSDLIDSMIIEGNPMFIVNAVSYRISFNDISQNGDK